ncbi:MAG: hypothetical protein L0Z50_42145 [Verrucomicrobiales bacterium]|nr:hypothetical protein [Verrucomicrobiales bacterium]
MNWANEPALGTLLSRGSGGEFGLVSNSSHRGTILLKACDFDKNGGVALAELMEVAVAWFMLWDAVSGNEFSTALQELIPALPADEVNGTLTFQGLSVFLLGQCFSQWDQDENSLLDAQELNAALGQPAKPE